MQKLVWQNADGDEINLTAGSYGVTNWAGLSNADINLQTQQVPYQDGSVFIDALLNNRELSITLAINDENDLEKRYTLKRELIAALNPKLGEGYLYYTNDIYTRRIKCIPHLPIFENKNANDSGTLKASVTWTACGVYWEDAEETLVTIERDSATELTLNSDVDVPFKGIFSNGTNSASLEINGKKITMDSHTYKCELNLLQGEKSFQSMFVYEDLDSGSFFKIKKAGDYIYFVGGMSSFSSRTSDALVFKTKDFLTFERVPLWWETNCYIVGFDYSATSGYIVIASNTGGLYKSPDGLSWGYVGSPSLPGKDVYIYDVAVLDEETLTVLLATNCGLLKNTDSSLSSWEVMADSFDVYFLKIQKASFSVNSQHCIAFVQERYSPKKIYALTESYTLIEITTTDDYYTFDYVNGYFYDYYNARRTSDFSTWEDLSIQIFSQSIIPLVNIIKTPTEYFGILRNGTLTRSYDGILFQEIRKYPTFTSYNVFSLFFDGNSNDIIIAGTPIGIESFYRGTIIPYGAGFKFAPTNKNGTLYINGDKAWKKGSETFTLPASAAAATADDNRYIIVSANGTVYTSEDGQSWTSQGRIFSLISNVKKIIYNPISKVYCALCSFSGASLNFQSKDLSTWTMGSGTGGTNDTDIINVNQYIMAIRDAGGVNYYDENFEVHNHHLPNFSGTTYSAFFNENTQYIYIMTSEGIYELPANALTIGAYSWISVFTPSYEGAIIKSIEYDKNHGDYYGLADNMIYHGTTVKQWQPFTVYMKNAIQKILKANNDLYFVYEKSLLSIDPKHNGNIINKLHGDLDIALSKKSFIIYKNDSDSSLVLKYRNKYIGV